jgi:hypothetical protein
VRERERGKGEMGTKVRVTPLSGAHSEAPLCYLLEVDDFRFLLDCGWTDTFDLSLLEPLARFFSAIINPFRKFSKGPKS